MNQRHFMPANGVRNQLHKPKWLPSSRAQILIRAPSKVHLIVLNMAAGTANNGVLWIINEGVSASHSRFLTIASCAILLVSLTDFSTHFYLVFHTTAACSHLYWLTGLKLKSISHENSPVGNLICTVNQPISILVIQACFSHVTSRKWSIFLFLVILWDGFKLLTDWLALETALNNFRFHFLLNFFAL